MTAQDTVRRSIFHPIRFGLKTVGLIETSVIAPYWLLNERLEIHQASTLGAYIGRIARLGQSSRTLAAMNRMLGPDQFARAGGSRLWEEYISQVGRTLTECIRMSAMRHEELRSVIALEGSEYLEDAMATHQETILFASHTGNIGAMLIGLSLAGFHITVARNPLPLQFVERKIAHALERLGIGSILIGKPAERNSPSLRFPRGILTAFIDEVVNPEHASWFHFGSAEFRAGIGPGLLAARKRAGVLCVTSRRTGDFHHVVTIHPPLSLSYSEDYRRDAHRVLQMGMNIIGDEVRRSPAEWLNWNYAKVRSPEVEGRNVVQSGLATEYHSESAMV
ncbi:MAG TPA: hypothetical protein VLY03_02220 [Bacteroidota bacterium]|nr:hypothetical protein [Bacteroidota bacterium]